MEVYTIALLVIGDYNSNFSFKCTTDVHRILKVINPAPCEILFETQEKATEFSD